MPVQTVLAPGARVVTGQVTVPIFGSATATLFSVTLPVFVTVKVYETGVAAAKTVGATWVLSTTSDGTAGIGSTSVSVAVTGTGFGFATVTGCFPDAVAVLFTTPASTSAWVSTYVAEQPVEAFGASVVAEHVTDDTLVSVTPTVVSVTLPVFLTRKW